jgi:hypothetical protein
VDACNSNDDYVSWIIQLYTCTSCGDAMYTEVHHNCNKIQPCNATMNQPGLDVCLAHVREDLENLLHFPLPSTCVLSVQCLDKRYGDSSMAG